MYFRLAGALAHAYFEVSAAKTAYEDAGPGARLGGRRVLDSTFLLCERNTRR